MDPSCISFSILKPLFQPIWLANGQAGAAHQKMSKQVPKECVSISLSKAKYHQSCKILADVVNINTKKDLTLKTLNVKSFNCD